MSKRKKSTTLHKDRSTTAAAALLTQSMLGAAALIVLAAFVVYYPALNGGFVLDDDALLTENEFIKAPDGLYKFWCTTETADYWPVASTSLWFEWRLWGINPTGYHVTNLILHIASALLLWAILRKLCIPGAYFAALIFAVHPVNVESVAWISQRKGLLAMLFSLLSVWWYLEYLARARLRLAAKLIPNPQSLIPISSFILHPSSFYCLSLAAFILAMLSKGSVAVLPVLLFGIVWWQRGTVPFLLTQKSGQSPSVLRLIPFFLVAVVLTLVNIWFQTHGTGEVFRTASFVERLLGAGSVIWFYLYKAILPLNLAFVYPQWTIQPGDMLWWLPLAAAVVVTMVLWWFRTGWSRSILFAWGFFCVGLIPVLGFVDVGFMRYSLVADHYQHLAIIGVIGLTASGWGVWHERVRKPARWIPKAAAALAAGILMLLTYQQSELYRDPVVLYQDTLKKNPNCWMAYNNLGVAFFHTNRLQEAIKYYRQSLSLKPDHAEALNNLGVALVQVGNVKEAIEDYHESLRIKPNYVDAYNNLGIALTKVGRVEDSINTFQKALRLNPDFPDLHNNLGNALLISSHLDKAIEHYRQAIQLDPEHAESHQNLAIALYKAGRLPEAIDQFKELLRLKPD
ncbi:MAG: tetratricopeptide repeat protein, partial [Thermoguttaceae bacterium]